MILAVGEGLPKGKNRKDTSPMNGTSKDFGTSRGKTPVRTPGKTPANRASIRESWIQKLSAAGACLGSSGKFRCGISPAKEFGRGLLYPPLQRSAQVAFAEKMGKLSKIQ
jgi:hypothetical protein